VRAEIDHKRRNAAYTIVKGKGSTYYAIAAGLARIVGAIRQDEQVVLTVSRVTANVEGVQDVALSMPRVVGREGIAADLFPDIDAQERAALHSSASLPNGHSTNSAAAEVSPHAAVGSRGRTGEVRRTRQVLIAGAIACEVGRPPCRSLRRVRGDAPRGRDREHQDRARTISMHPTHLSHSPQITAFEDAGRRSALYNFGRPASRNS